MLKKVFKLLIPVLILSVVAGCVEKYKTTTVDAIVIEKDYDAKKTTYKKVTENGKIVLKKKVKPEEYEVEIQYNDIVREYDSKELYNKVKVGQKIKALYKKGYDKNGKLVTEYIELID